MYINIGRRGWSGLKKKVLNKSMKYNPWSKTYGRLVAAACENAASEKLLSPTHATITLHPPLPL